GLRPELRWSAHWGLAPLVWVRVSRARHQLLHPWSRGFRGSRIEAMGAIGAMATIEAGAIVEAGATVETGATGQGGAASPVLLGMSPGAPSRGSCDPIVRVSSPSMPAG